MLEKLGAELELTKLEQKKPLAKVNTAKYDVGCFEWSNLESVATLV